MVVALVLDAAVADADVKHVQPESRPQLLLFSDSLWTEAIASRRRLLRARSRFCWLVWPNTCVLLSFPCASVARPGPDCRLNFLHGSNWISYAWPALRAKIRGELRHSFWQPKEHDSYQRGDRKGKTKEQEQAATAAGKLAMTAEEPADDVGDQPANLLQSPRRANQTDYPTQVPNLYGIVVLEKVTHGNALSVWLGAFCAFGAAWKKPTKTWMLYGSFLLREKLQEHIWSHFQDWVTARTSGEAAEVLLGEPATLGALVSGFGRHLFSVGEWRVLVPFQASHFDGNQKVHERTPLSAGTWSLSGKSLPEVILSKSYGLLGCGLELDKRRRESFGLVLVDFVDLQPWFACFLPEPLGLLAPKSFKLTRGGLRGGGAVAESHRGTDLSSLQWPMRIRHQVTLEAYLQEVTAENLLLKLPSRPVVRVKAAASLYDHLLLLCVPCRVDGMPIDVHQLFLSKLFSAFRTAAGTSEDSLHSVGLCFSSIFDEQLQLGDVPTDKQLSAFVELVREATWSNRNLCGLQGTLEAHVAIVNMEATWRPSACPCLSQLCSAPHPRSRRSHPGHLSKEGWQSCSLACLAVVALPSINRRRTPLAKVKAKASATEGPESYEKLEAFLQLQRQSPPASDPLGGSLTPYNDGPLDMLFIAVFRQVMSGVAGWQSPLAFWGPEAYDGMLEVAHAQQWGRSLQETEDSAMSVIDGLLPEEGKSPRGVYFRIFKALFTELLQTRGHSTRVTSKPLLPALVMGQSCCRAAAPCEEVPNQVLHETTEACDSEAESLLRELFRSNTRCMGELEAAAFILTHRSFMCI
ncbi:psbN [Symbiodinium microadriaticum]|nr:psbN [Symbiodinium microadriaticum]CAE7945385.1 psbN [Symbiodinium sp. KB8]